MAPAQNGSLKSRTTAPMSIVDAPRRPRARGLGRYRSRRAARLTRSRVSSAIGTRVGALFRTLETVLWETLAATAMSRMVGTWRRWPAARTGALDAGSLSPSALVVGDPVLGFLGAAADRPRPSPLLPAPTVQA